MRAQAVDEVVRAGKKDAAPVEVFLQRLMPADALRIRGRHNACNALAALALATAGGGALGPMLHALREYVGEPHRVQPVGVIGDVEYIDDSKGTNVGATLAALHSLGAERRLVVILGGDGKGQDFSVLRDAVRRYARAVVLMGRDAGLIGDTLRDTGVPLLPATDMVDAVQQAAAAAKVGDVVLLSPACASFDMYRNYLARATAFTDAVTSAGRKQWGGACMSWRDWLPKREATEVAEHIPVRINSRDFVRTRPLEVREHGFDQPLLWAVVGLVLWGLVMVYSATIALPDSPRFASYDPLHFVLRQGFAVAAGFVFALVAFQIPMAAWEVRAPHVFAFSLLLLVAVVIPFIGREVNGAYRWIPLGFFTFQPSELAKFAVVLFASNYMVRKMDIKERFIRAVTPIATLIAVAGVLLLLEPDMGAFMVIVVIAMGILFLGGVNARVFFLLSGLLLIAFSAMIWLSEWRRDRIFAYLDPWSAEHALGRGYQLSHSLIAFGRGEIFGVGLGGSVEKLSWLPEAHTDFLMAVIGEEFGLVGVLLVIAIFMWMTRRILQIGRQAIALDQVFSGLVAQGVGLWIGFQAFINIGVNLGALPTKGLTLPLMSYGGSAILMNLIALAVVLRVDHENRQMMRGGRA